MRAEGTSTPALVDLDIRFHQELVALSGSRFLKQSWMALAPVLHAVITLGNRVLAERDPKQNFERIIDSHERIVAPLVARDVEGVVAKLGEQFEIARAPLPVHARADDAGKGAVVSVPFGRGRTRGVVVDVVDSPPA